MISDHQLRAALREWDIDPTIGNTTDVSYRCPSRRWIVDDFGPDLIFVLGRLGFRYQEGSQDCDDYALFAMSYARMLNANMDRRGQAGIAFGVYIYRTLEMVRHALNVALVYEDSNLVPVWFEPQTGKIQVLDKAERQSCEFYLF